MIVSWVHVLIQEIYCHWSQTTEGNCRIFHGLLESGYSDDGTLWPSNEEGQAAIWHAGSKQTRSDLMSPAWMKVWLLAICESFQNLTWRWCSVVEVQKCVNAHLNPHRHVIDTFWVIAVSVRPSAPFHAKYPPFLQSLASPFSACSCPPGPSQSCLGFGLAISYPWAWPPKNKRSTCCLFVQTEIL